MADIYQETREGQTPTVQSAGSNMVVNWQQQPSGFSRASSILSGIMTSLEQDEEKKRKKEKDKADMYQTLREAGYDPKAAYEAAQAGEMPPASPGKSLKDEKTEAEIEASKAKADYWRNGGKKTDPSVMTPNQLQARLKFLTEKPYSQRTPEDQQETEAINKRLRELSTASTTPPAAAALPAATPPALPPTEKKIRVKRKKDGAIGNISEKFFDPVKYERA